MLSLDFQANSEKPNFTHVVFLFPLTRNYYEINSLRFFFVIFEGFFALGMSRQERHFQGITREIRNFSEKIISELFFVSNNFVSEGKAWVSRLLKNYNF